MVEEFLRNGYRLVAYIGLYNSPTCGIHWGKHKVNRNHTESPIPVDEPGAEDPILGEKLIQVEPFVEALLSVHEFIAQGNKPRDLKRNILPYFVYLAERNASSALLVPYSSVSVKKNW